MSAEIWRVAGLALRGALLTACLGFVLTGQGATGRPELVLVPPGIDLPGPAQPGQCLLVLRNSSGQPLHAVKLSWIAPANVGVRSGSDVAIPQLAPGAEAAWPLEISQTLDETVADVLHFRVDYSVSQGGVPVPQVLVQSAVVKTRERLAFEKLVEVQVKTTLETLESSRNATIDLLFVNKSGRTVTVRKVTPSIPSFLSLQETGGSGPLVVGPLQTGRKQFLVEAKSRVIPGKYLIVFETEMESNEFGAIEKRKAVASQEVTVGVLGESALAKVLGVASFLLFPGWLALMAASLAHRFGWWQPGGGGAAERKPFVEANSAEFWLLAVTISLFFAGLLRLITGRWYFVQYGLEDILWVWAVSIGLGLLGYAGTWAVIRRRRALRSPSENDSPCQLLLKISRQSLTLILDRVTLPASGSHEPAFLVEKGGASLAATWVAPQILLDFSRIPDQERKVEIRAELNGERRPGQMARLLRQHEHAVSFKASPVPGPRTVEKKEWQAAGDAASIVGET